MRSVPGHEVSTGPGLVIATTHHATRSLPLPVLTPLRGRLTSRRPHTAMSERWTTATGIGQRICKAHVFDETFRVNRAFNAKVFVAATCGRDGVRSVRGAAE